jgi:hypothetical protein
METLGVPAGTPDAIPDADIADRPEPPAVHRAIESHGVIISQPVSVDFTTNIAESDFRHTLSLYRWASSLSRRS